MNSTHDVDRLREVFTAFDPASRPQVSAAVQTPAATSNAPSQAPDRAPVRWSRLGLVAAAVVATIVVPIAVVNSFDAVTSTAGPAPESGQATTVVTEHQTVTADRAAPSTAISVGASGQGTAAVTEYQSMMADRAVIQRAEQELTSRCMAAAGFEYTPMEQLPAKWRELTQPLSVQAASESGYASVLAPVTSPAGQANDAYFAALSKADQRRYATAMSGVPGHTAEVPGAGGTVLIPTTGCLWQADRDLFGDAVKWARVSAFISDLGSLPEYRPDDDATLKHATQEWSSCMEDRGHRFADPSAAMQQALSEATPFNRLDASGNEVPEETAGTDPDGARAIAVADATCRAQTGWDDANRGAAQRALAAAFAAHESDVQAYNAMASAGLAKARSVLGE